MKMLDSVEMREFVDTVFMKRVKLRKEELVCAIIALVSTASVN